jgi:hypothetical protein
MAATSLLRIRWNTLPTFRIAAITFIDYPIKDQLESVPRTRTFGALDRFALFLPRAKAQKAK